MKYPHIIDKVCREFWALTPNAHDAIVSALAAHLDGGNKVFFGDEERDPDNAPKEYEVIGDTAIIRVHGVLGKHLSRMETKCGGCSMDSVAQMLDVAAHNYSVRKIFMDFNSPGGTVTGTPELARKIAESPKRTFAFCDSDCCSGALWLASQCKTFWVTQSSNIGSVGVRMILMDYTEALKKEGIKVNSISSGKYKLTGAYFKPLEPDEYDMLKAESDRIHEQFKTAVTSNRKIPNEHMEGQIYRGEIAVQHGFIDGLVESKEEALELTRGDI